MEWRHEFFCEEGFGGDAEACRTDGELPGTNYGTFFWSIIAVFQVLTGENWNEVMYTGLTACTSVEGSHNYLCGFIVVLYFVFLNIVGNYMILNLFLAILMAGFEDDDDEEEDEAGGGDGQVAGGSSAKVVPIGDSEPQGEKEDVDPDAPVFVGKALFLFDVDSPVRKAAIALSYNKMFESFILLMIMISTVNLCLDPMGASIDMCYKPKYPDGTPIVVDGGLGTDANGDRQPIPWDKINPGHTMHKVNGLWTTGGNLTADGTPLHGFEDAMECGSLGTYLEISAEVLNIIFLIEMLAKIVALGFVLHPHAYLRGGWNILDFVIVMVAIIGWADIKGAEFLRALRAARALRPLRAVNRLPNLKMVVNALFKALPRSMSDLVVLVIFTIILGVTGQNFFGGAMMYCNNDGATTSSGFFGPVPYPGAVTMFDCVGYNRTIVYDETKKFASGPQMTWCSYTQAAGFKGLGCEVNGHCEATKDGWKSLNGSGLVECDTERKESWKLDDPYKSLWPRPDKAEEYSWRDASFNHFDTSIGLGCDTEACLQQEPGCDPLTDGDSKLCECRCFDAVEDTCDLLPNQTLIDLCHENGADGLPGSLPVLWEPMSINFDGVFAAMNVVLEVASGEMWPDIMYTTQDAWGKDMPMRAAPHFEGRMASIWYIMVTLLIAFMMLQVFVGKVIAVYDELSSEGEALLTDAQVAMKETLMKALFKKPVALTKPPAGEGLKLQAFNLVQHKNFDTFILSCILLNAITMCLSIDTQPGYWTMFLTISNYAFLVIFTVEMGLKIFGLNFKQYWRSNWNRFDGTLVVLGWFGALVNLPIFSLFRILRVARVIRAVKSLPELLILFKTLIISIPAIFNVTIVLFLVMLIFGVLFMNLFGKVKYMPGIVKQGLIGPDANFQHFWPSFVTMFRMVTGESFNGLMHDAMLEQPYCDPMAHGSIKGNCAMDSSWFFSFAAIMFQFFFVLASYILLSLVLGVIMDNFSQAKRENENAVTEDDLEAFGLAWQQIDHDGDGFINQEELIRLVQEVPYPLGLKGAPESASQGGTMRKQANALIQKSHIPRVNGQMVTFNDCLAALAKLGMPDFELPADVLEEIQYKEKAQKQKQLKRMNTSTEAEASDNYTIGQYNAVSLMQSAMRGYIYRRKMEAVVNQMKQSPPPGGQLPPL